MTLTISNSREKEAGFNILAQAREFGFQGGRNKLSIALPDPLSSSEAPLKVSDIRTPGVPELSRIHQGSQLLIEMSGIAQKSPIIRAARFGIGGLRESASMRLLIANDGDLVGVRGLDEDDIGVISLRYARRAQGETSPANGFFSSDYRMVFGEGIIATLEKVSLSHNLESKTKKPTEQREWLMITGPYGSTDEEGAKQFLEETGLPVRVDLAKTVQWWLGGRVYNNEGQLQRLTAANFALSPFLRTSE